MSDATPTLAQRITSDYCDQATYFELRGEYKQLTAQRDALLAALQAMLKLSFTHPVDPQFRVSVHDQARAAISLAGGGK